MRSLLKSLTLALALLAGAASASAGTLPGSGPNPGWTDMQKTEWYIGYMSKAAAICRFYDKSLALSALASLSPYGRIGLKGFTGDGFYGAACQGIGEEADALLGDKAAFTRYFAEIYDCKAGDDCPVGWDKHASDHTCSQKVHEVLNGLAIDSSDVQSIRLSSRLEGTGNHAIGPLHQARIRLKACQGSLYVELGAQCTVTQSYTRGDCEVAGVSSF